MADPNFTWNPVNLSAADLAAIYDETGYDIESLDDDELPLRIKAAVIGTGYALIKQRTDPEFTTEMGRAIGVDELMLSVGEDVGGPLAHKMAALQKKAEQRQGSRAQRRGAKRDS